MASSAPGQRRSSSPASCVISLRHGKPPNAAAAGRAVRRRRPEMALMLDVAKRLLIPSARSDVPPFMVMDVMTAAARIEAAGGRVIHMEVGQPAAAAPATAIAAAKAALDRADISYTAALGIPSLRTRIARHYTDAYGTRDRPGAYHRHDGIVGGFHPGVPDNVRARRPRRDHLARLSALSPYPHRAWLRAGGNPNRRRHALGAYCRCADGGPSVVRRSRACWSRAPPIPPGP